MSEPVRIFSTLSGEKSPLQPLQPDVVTMYVCGVTVYAPCHVGHARSFCSFDVVYRYLLHKGHNVRYVRNFTDVDDKIIRRGLDEGVPAIEIADRYVAEFHRSMDALFLLRPDEEPRVTQFIAPIIDMVQALIDRGHAYVVEGDVYFSVATNADYGKLARRQLDEQEVGARVEVDERKRHPYDFALWKAAKPGEPSWESPWGPGRPGWHIECSAMSVGLLGPRFDIHGGGRDLIFPHHENEVAQTECATGERPCVQHWMHGGHLTIDAEKMSKSLGNVFGVAEILARYAPEVLRLFYLQVAYRSPLDFSFSAMDEAEATLDRWYTTLKDLDTRIGDARKVVVGTSPLRPAQVFSAGPDPLADLDVNTLPGPERGFAADVARLLPRIEEAMDDDFNTARALGQLHEFVRKVNRFLSSGSVDDGARAVLACAARHHLLRATTILGLLHESPSLYFERNRTRRLALLGVSIAEIDDAIAARRAARDRRDFAEGDRIRDALAARGVVLKDGPSGTDWEATRPAP